MALESTTLASAPLIYYNRNRHSIEATWKYLLVCSVGIALAMLGLLFFAYAALRGGAPVSLLLDDLLVAGPAPLPPLAARRLRLSPGRVRHQDGTGPAAHLEARRLWRGAGAGRRPARRRADQSGVPGGSARHAGDGRGRRPADGPARPARAWGLFAGRRGVVHDAPDRPQADARLFQRRAHGACWRLASASAGWPPSAPCCT